jgi:predicted ATPase/DNA-binding XRE family transcriptional regulator
MAGHAGDTFGARLRHLRESAGLTREALAERAELSIDAVGALEAGQRRHPYPFTVRVLAEALGISEEQRAELVALLPTRVDLPARRTGSLPSPMTSFLGRERDIATATALLHDPDTRLLTLVGPGGVGKTRLALRLATEVRELYPDGAWFVSLAPITDPAMVIPAIMQAMRLRGPGDREPRDVLVQALRLREMLLVLDNFEQVAEASPAIDDLLRACPLVTAVVTSRSRLRVRGEREFPVRPLAVPNGSSGTSPGLLAQVPAVALFLQRARAVRADFELTSENAGTIAELCVRLEGLPLAIELAAVRSRVLSPREMLDLLPNRLSLLVEGEQDRPTRHQTMRGAIAWSHDLLGPDAQMLFRRLSVFAGGCGLDAAEVLVPGQGRAAIASLIDQSLVQVEVGAMGERRIGMLELMREYATERLEASGEVDIARNAHASYAIDLVAVAREEMEGPGRRAAHERVKQELGNVRAALTWLHGRGDADACGRAWPRQRGR